MPIIKWAKKALKVSRKKQIRNQHFKNMYTQLRVAFEKAIKSEDVEVAKSVWFNKKEEKEVTLKGGVKEMKSVNVKSWLQSIIDTLVKKNIIHANNAARKKAKYAKMLKSISK